MHKINKKAISSLVSGIVSMVIPLIGLIFGIIGIIISVKSVKEINSENEKGVGLAIAGRVTSIIGVVYQVVLISGFAFYMNGSVQHVTKVITKN